MAEPRVTDNSTPLRPPLASMRGPRRHAWVVWAVLVTVVAVPLLELFVIIRSGQAIGFGWTFLLIVALSALGAWLMKREGSQAWRALKSAATAGRVPTDEAADAGLIVVGGMMLLFPGFISDVIGLFFLLPFTRPLARKALAYALAREGQTLDVRRPPRPSDPTVLEGEVVSGDVVTGDVVHGDPIAEHRRPLAR